ncbi:uncharacterized protein B0J16DRAFT_399584 [Fusarium flagelliforme]|uniref:Uncharacterized protein n=1 Tax=Fusarium flagelliforme TaxID=2675880 RepID=A0A395MWJ8_9HYPO|nr:uncharacterized protein B0J16DRAFT_399584 [Fusarium flagelliforme]KAH7185755.1 hypothetical protein B0J16DRAFT_399584 [Fusarium flagelliforme]RFN52288.1 hypothetical protein FIE12Z_3438 [Fusarium flagelliforme]
MFDNETIPSFGPVVVRLEGITRSEFQLMGCFIIIVAVSFATVIMCGILGWVAWGKAEYIEGDTGNGQGHEEGQVLGPKAVFAATLRIKVQVLTFLVLCFVFNLLGLHSTIRQRIHRAGLINNNTSRRIAWDCISCVLIYVTMGLQTFNLWMFAKDYDPAKNPDTVELNNLPRSNGNAGSDQGQQLQTPLPAYTLAHLDAIRC